MGYTVKTRIKVIRQNTTITDNDFGGWLAVNNGHTAVEVNKVTLQPSEGLDFTSCVLPDVKWDSPIQVIIPEVGGEVVLTQLIYKRVQRDDDVSHMRD